MIRNPSKDLTLIVYNTPKPPRYLKLNKRLIRSVILIIPILIIAFISVSFMYSMYLKNKVNQLKDKEPKLIAQLKSETESLQSTVATLQKANDTLTRKISKGTGGTTTSVTSLGLFTSPIGLVDLREKEMLKIEGIEHKTEGNKIKLSFNLSNNLPDNAKIAGYLTVVQYQGNLIQYYPDYELGEKSLLLEYSKGESFGFSRFRPTIATFQKLRKTSAKYKIFIFSRNGDLISYKQIGPFNIQ